MCGGFYYSRLDYRTIKTVLQIEVASSIENITVFVIFHVLKPSFFNIKFSFISKVNSILLYRLLQKYENIKKILKQLFFSATFLWNSSNFIETLLSL